MADQPEASYQPRGVIERWAIRILLRRGWMPRFNPNGGISMLIEPDPYVAAQQKAARRG